MMLPFGIQLKGFIIGIIFAYLVVPFLQAQLSGLSSRRAAPSQ